ncbi:MAG: hypothetical protein CAF42_002375 [Nitrospira sp. CG24B]|nr:MAG: hypothetical protein CAF42_002375 [Nitrospira sp. CG24B]
MKIFKTLIEGKNCYTNIDGSIRRLGFFTTRIACGIDPTQAEEKIRQQLDQELRSKILNNPDDPPEINFGKFIEIDSANAQSIALTGCTWYPQDSSDQT